MLAFHVVFPLVLLAVFLARAAAIPDHIKDDLPIFALVVLFHLSDIIFALAGGFNGILWLVMLVSLVHFTLLGWIYLSGKRSTSVQESFSLNHDQPMER